MSSRNCLIWPDVVDIPTAAEGYTDQQERDEATGDYLDKNTQALAQSLSERQVAVVWNDLIRGLERITQTFDLNVVFRLPYVLRGNKY